MAPVVRKGSDEVVDAAVSSSSSRLLAVASRGVFPVMVKGHGTRASHQTRSIARSMKGKKRQSFGPWGLTSESSARRWVAGALLYGGLELELAMVKE
jgi:hypothetical protein